LIFDRGKGPPWKRAVIDGRKDSSLIDNPNGGCDGEADKMKDPKQGP
jgi:hypothetical protein